MEQAHLETWEGRQMLSGMPVECFILEECKPGIFAASHWHSAAELIYVRKGGYRILAGGESRLLREGECVLIRPRQLHSTICPELPEISLLVLKFEPGFLLGAEPLPGEGELLENMRSWDGAAFWLGAEDCAAGKLPERMGELLAEIRETRLGWRMAVRACIWTILLQVLRAAGEQPHPSGMGSGALSEEFYPVLDYLEQHCTEGVSVEDVLPLCHLSYSRFSVKFRQLTGFSLTEYCNRMRIDRARRLLERGAQGIGEVAESCGFTDLCYFDRLFRRYTGVSPSGFRRQRQPDEEE